MENYDIQKFNDGTIDIQTYIDVDKEIGVNYVLRDCFEIRGNGAIIHCFPIWDKIE